VVQPVNLLNRVSLQQSFVELHKTREVPFEFNDSLDLLLFDGLKVIALIWILSFGTCEYLFNESVNDPWLLLDYFKLYLFNIVYSSNIGFDEFFMIAFFF